MAITEREQKFIDAINAARAAVGEAPLTGEKLHEVVQAVQLMLPAWDSIMPLLIKDIVRAVKEANA